MTNEFMNIIIVDSSNLECQQEVARVVEQADSLRGLISLQHTHISSLTHQKNLGLMACERDALVQILDDDVLPPRGYLSAMQESLVAGNLIGVSGVTHEFVQKKNTWRLFGYVFGLISTKKITFLRELFRVAASNKP
jgi:hypothetical protein